MRILGTTIMVIGIVLLVFGINSTHVFREKINKEATGRYTDSTMWYIIGGVAMIVGGATVARRRP